MKKEIERIFYDIDKDFLKPKILEIGSKLEREEFLQKRIVYDFGRVEEGKYFHFLRLRDEGNKITLTYKKIHDGEYPLENEAVVSDFDTMRSILQNLNIKETSYQENKREVYLYKNTQITVDTWPYLDPVCEVESHTEEELNEVIQLLHLDTSKSFNSNVNEVYKLKYGKYIEDLSGQVEIKFNGHNPFLS